VSLGSSGYGTVMTLAGGDIEPYFNQYLIYPQQPTAYSFKVRIYFRSYDGTVKINDDHNLTAISGTAPLITGQTSSNQHYAKIIVEEYL
jgi:hypothetical protein